MNKTHKLFNKSRSRAPPCAFPPVFRILVLAYSCVFLNSAAVCARGEGRGAGGEGWGGAGAVPGRGCGGVSWGGVRGSGVRGGAGAQGRRGGGSAGQVAGRAERVRRAGKRPKFCPHFCFQAARAGKCPKFCPRLGVSIGRDGVGEEVAAVLRDEGAEGREGEKERRREERKI